MPDAFDLDVPRYSLNLYDNYTTSDGQELDDGCSQQYRTEFALQTASMVGTVNGKISSGDVCPGESGRMVVSGSASNFLSDGNSV